MWALYVTVVAIFATLFLISAIYALYWASKNKQFKNFEAGAKTIFDDEEPEGVPTDFFPGQDPRSRQHSK
jgi:nitrogen fixation-related uncharacterized protein